MTDYPETVIRALQEEARQLRLQSLAMIHRRGAGHPGGTLSCAEIIAALFHKMRLDPARPDWPERDRFILSKGHASAILYVALARRGFFPVEDLYHWGELDCHLQGHPDRLKTPGVEMTAGILGHGLPVAVGLALSARLRGQQGRVYVLLGDGECQGGIVWEGAMAAHKFRLAGITAILDHNDVQLDGPVHDIMPLEPLADKWRAFGWAVFECDGHDFVSLTRALAAAERVSGKPAVLLCHTVKGKGIPFAETHPTRSNFALTSEQDQEAVAYLDTLEAEVTDESFAPRHH